MSSAALNPSPPEAAAALPEQLTMHMAGQVLGQLRQALAQQPTQAGEPVVLDARELRVFDSSAVAVLLDVRRQLLARGKTLQLAGAPERLQQLAALYGVGELLAV